MSETTYYPYVGSGQIYARVAGAAAGLFAIGNASQLDLTAKEKKDTLGDFTKPGGGIYASLTRIESVMAAMKLHDLNKTNVARAVFGIASAVESGSVEEEVVKAYLGALCPLEHIDIENVVVKNTGGSTTYVDGTDYEVRAGGIIPLVGGAITEASNVKVDYDYGSYSKIEAMTTGAIILELHFEGLNEANSGKPVVLDIYRLQLSPTKALSLLGEKFAELTLEGEVLKDPTKTGTGISQYFRAKMAD